MAEEPDAEGCGSAWRSTAPRAPGAAARGARRRSPLRSGLIAPRGGVRRLCPAAPPAHVDHSHETGRVRGVLCFSRNAALGQFKISPR
ncbi:endonuclease domain-containing protein [Streptomyces incarnatus]|uniref:endonuclease domain-containing protein n=1 Tax=unclassified Streptomyces TaxID=2593676 RepID=UPI0028CB4D7C|nr:MULTISPECIES: endonuclease domain-containing protein [Streptomyces]